MYIFSHQQEILMDLSTSSRLLLQSVDYNLLGKKKRGSIKKE